jgi:hypothetical protein
MLKIRALRIYIKTFFLLILGSSAVFAQRPFGNEWINFSQSYYKIKIARDGIYRLDKQALDVGGLNTSTVDPRQIQLYFRGKQVPIFVSGESDGKFDAGDYIEFWGQRNDGALDVLLYAKASDISHADYSTYTDTSAYFLTISTQGPYERIQQSTTISGSGAIESIIGTQAKYFHDIYQDGSPYIDGSESRYIPEYTSGEGWMSVFINKQSSTTSPKQKIDTFNITDALASSSFTPTLEFKTISQNHDAKYNPDHRLQINVQSSSSSQHTVLDTSYEGYQVIRRVLPLDQSDVDGQTIVTIKPVTIADVFSTITVAYEKLTYEKELNAEVQLNTPFEYGPQTGGGNITFGFNVPGSFGTPALYLYDLTSGNRSESFYNSGKVYFTLPAPDTISRYVLVRQSDFAGAQASSAILRNIDLNQGYNYLLVTHSRLLNAAQQYADYKATQKIKGLENFKPLVVTVDELYDVFSYGVKHPIAIQNFSAYMYKKAAVKPQYLFLVGKGMAVNIARDSADKDLVPVLGTPASDLLYVAGIPNGFTGRDTVHPVISVGRLSARREQEVLAYLGKLKEYDASPPALWHKDALHVGGGQDLGTQKIAELNLNMAKKIYEGKSIGGHVTTYLSKAADPVTPNLKAAIQSGIENGVGLLTYYGHAAGTLLGVEIADFKTLNNKGKYPIMYLNGCSVGDFSISGSTSMAEDYLLRPDKGGIVWLSHSTTALSNTLSAQMNRFYTNMSKDSTYGTTVGKVWAKSIADLKVPTSATSQDRLAVFAWTLQGDPSVQFHYEQLPDYYVDENEVETSPKEVFAGADVFHLKIVVSNRGRATDALPGIKVTQILPNNQSIELGEEFVTKGVYYKDTIEFIVHPGGRPIQGTNRFSIVVNSDKSIEESNYDNNRTERIIIIKGNGSRNLSPANYAVIGTDTVTLVSQSRNLFDTASEMYYEIDTVNTFNSPFKKASGLIKGSNISSWHVQLLSGDSIVYYWRSRLNLPDNNGGAWDVRSFTHLTGKGPGWSQSKWPQFSGITGDAITLDSALRQLAYGKSFGQLSIKGVVWKLPTGTGIKREGEVQTTCWYGTGTLALMVIDRYTLKPVLDRIVSGAPPSGASCNGALVHYYQYNMNDATERQSFVNDVDKIKNGNYVAIMTRFNVQSYKDWEPEVIAAFKKIGAQEVQNIKRDSTAYVLAGIKGETIGKLLGEDTVYDPVFPADSPGDTAQIETSLEGVANPNGSILSEKIGPSTKWKNVYQHWHNRESPSTDNIILQVLGVTDTGDVVLMDNITAENTDISSIDAAKYKFIRLKALISDTINYTPAQLKDWTVLYDDVPEGTLVIDKQFRFDKDTVSQGQKVHIKVKYQNISPYPMKSVLVNTSMMDAAGRVVGTARNKRYKALQPGEFFYVEDTFTVSINMGGMNQVSVFVNPDFDQPELSLENNYINVPFYVPTGRFNPIMDVTFDGRHLRYGDMVSTNPVILVDAWVDKAAMPLYDTTFFTLTLTGPDNLVPHRINFSSPEVKFKESTFEDNHARVTFTPVLEPGTYTFTAQVRDVKGQKSGLQPYTVTFKVLGESKASRVYMYPNPLRNTSYFVFTLTGNKVPDMLAIDIFDVRGKLVKQISLPVKSSYIGYNEIEWDGRGDNGEMLANGVYLYQIAIRNSGTDLPIYSVPQDRDLEKTYGKIIILRE